MTKSTRNSTEGIREAAAPRPGAPVGWADRHYRTALAGLILLAALLRIGLLVDSLRNNPFATHPYNDAEVYWDAAARIAAGQLTNADPFFSAPLYEFVVGAVRAAGGGFASLYLLQLAVHLATAALVAAIARRRFNAATGLLAAALFLALIEPAYFTTRVLNCTIQLGLVTLLWWQLVRVQDRPSWPRTLLAGALLGLNCLATPPLMLLVVVAGPWLWLQSPRRPADLARAAAVVAVALAVIAPATIHNYRTTGVFIPIQAASGITLRFGNGPKAAGVFAGAESVRPNRQQMHDDAQRAFRERFGRDGNWKEIDDYYKQLAWDYLREDPARAAVLLAKKAYWFLTGQHYGDIYYPTIEIYDGIAPWLRTAPLQLSWLIGPAVVALLLAARRPIRHAPELLLFAIPFVVVVAFWYSPRFRFPVTSVVAVYAAAAFVGLAARDARRRTGVAAVAALAVMLLLTAVNKRRIFDSVIAHGAPYAIRASLVFEQAGDPDRAARHLRNLALTDLPEAAGAMRRLTALFQKSGDWLAVEQWCREQLAARPDQLEIQFLLAKALQAQRRHAEALPLFAAFVAARPDSVPERNDYGRALVEANRLDQAVAQFEAARRLADEQRHVEGRVASRTNLASTLNRRNQPGDAEAALREFEAALQLDPANQQIADAVRMQRQFIEQKSGNTWTPAEPGPIRPGTRLKRVVPPATTDPAAP